MIPPDLDPEDPVSKAFRAVTQLGHDELIDLVISSEAQGCIPTLYSPIWRSLIRAARLCETNVLILQFLIDKRAVKSSYADILAEDIQSKCCDKTLRLLLKRGKEYPRLHILGQFKSCIFRSIPW